MSFSELVADMDTELWEEFGVPTSYEPAGGDAVEVDGIFTENAVRVTAGEAGVTSTGPRIDYRRADLAAAGVAVRPEDDEPVITINGVTYTLREAEEGGEGVVKLWLQKQ